MITRSRPTAPAVNIVLSKLTSPGVPSEPLSVVNVISAAPRTGVPPPSMVISAEYPPNKSSVERSAESVIVPELVSVISDAVMAPFTSMSPASMSIKPPTLTASKPTVLLLIVKVPRFDIVPLTVIAPAEPASRVKLFVPPTTVSNKIAAPPPPTPLTSAFKITSPAKTTLPASKSRAASFNKILTPELKLIVGALRVKPKYSVV